MATVLEERATEMNATAQAREPAACRFTVEEYYRMGEAGVFASDENVELIEGAIVKMSPKKPKHAGTVRRAARCFGRKLGERVYVITHDPAHVSDTSEPEPDLILAQPNENDYLDAHPTPEQIFLVLEVSLTTLNYDRNLKGRIYAAAGIAQYLILNLNTRELEDYREPDADGYRSKKIYRADERFNLVAFPEVEIEVGDLLPPE